MGGIKSMQISDIWTASVSATMLTTGNEYLKRQNNASKVLMTTRAVENGLLEKGQCRYKLKWEQENGKVKLH